jgi:molecular chaperone GrpE
MQNSPASDPGEQPSGREGDGSVAVEGQQRDLQAELDRMEDRYKRALADLDNYRKRSAREVERRVAESKAASLREWLEAVDSVERALAMQSDPENPVALGLRAVLEQMEAVLERQGVERIGAVGERFDPERHEAVGVQTTDEVADRTVIAVTRSGYKLGERMLRPAQVIVSRSEGD